MTPRSVAIDILTGVGAGAFHTWQSGRMADSAADSGVNRLKRPDDFIGEGSGLRGDELRRALAGGAESDALGNRLRIANRLERLDDFIGEGSGLRGDELRRALAGGAESGTLGNRLRAADRLHNLDDFTGGGPRLRGDKLRRALTGNAKNNELNKKLGAEIQLLGFRGIGITGIDPALEAEHGLIRAGHVGISLDKGKTVIGFHPSKEAIAELKSLGSDVFQFLKQGGALHGQVQDDTKIFIRASQLAEMGIRGNNGQVTTVYQHSFYVSNEKLKNIQQKVWHELEQGSPYPSWYRFPERKPGTPMPLQCNNCATWPRTLGIPIPEETGQLKTYIEELKKAGGGQVWSPRQ